LLFQNHLKSPLEFAVKASVWEALKIRVKEWFVYLPPSSRLTADLSTLKSTALVLFSPLLGAFLIYGTVILSAVGEVFIVGLYISLSAYWLKEAQGLVDNYRRLLFTSAVAATVLAGVLLWFKVVNFWGFWAISLAAVPVFALLYVFGSFGQVRTRRIVKTLSVFLAIIGLISLTFSAALVYHVEDRSEVSHSQNIFREYFLLNRQLPEEVVNINLTTQDHFLVDMTKIQNANFASSASIKFTVSDQPLGPNATIYFSANTLDSAYIKGWDVPKNATYVFTLQFNYISANYVWVEVTRVWSTIEMIPATVATPLLAQYMTPTLIAASALLVGSIAVPIQQELKLKFAKKKNDSERGARLSY
jgi:hypothetical protein